MIVAGLVDRLHPRQTVGEQLSHQASVEGGGGDCNVQVTRGVRLRSVTLSRLTANVREAGRPPRRVFVDSRMRWLDPKPPKHHHVAGLVKRERAPSLRERHSK